MINVNVDFCMSRIRKARHQVMLLAMVVMLLVRQLAQVANKGASNHEPTPMKPTLAFPSNARLPSLHRPHLPSTLRS